MTIEKIIVLEDSSKARFGGGQKITLKVIELLSDVYEIVLIDCTDSSLFFCDAKIKSSQAYSLNWLGKIIIGDESSFMVGWKEIFSAPYYFLNSIYKINNILKLCNSNKENSLLYATTKKMLILTYLLNLLFGYRYIFHAHALDNIKSVFFKLIKHPMKRAERILCVSNVVSKNIDLPQCEVVYNPSDYRGKSKVISKSGKKIVATFSTLIPLKGINFFVDSYQYLQNKKRVEYWIFGAGSELGKLKKKASRNIKFKGFSSNVIDELSKNIDIVVVPSIVQEACPVVPIEAMGIGVPVVCTNVGGQAEIVKNGIVGFHVPVKDPMAIAKKIDFLLDDETTYQTISRNAAKYSDKIFNKMAFNSKIKKAFS